MSEWVSYTGSDEQIEEMIHSIDNGGGYLCRRKGLPDRHETLLCPMADGTIVTHYLICDPRPLADMICQQARTGQPVWVRYTLEWDRRSDTIETDCTITPDWNIPNAEYSFAPFDD